MPGLPQALEHMGICVASGSVLASRILRGSAFGGGIAGVNLCLSRPVSHTILMTTLIPGNASAIPLNLGIPLRSYQQGEMKMAQKTQVILVDDIDGSAATQTVTFALDGVSYEIDLTDEHAAELRADLHEGSPT